jgi:hypothetical protein
LNKQIYNEAKLLREKTSACVDEANSFAVQLGKPFRYTLLDATDKEVPNKMNDSNYINETDSYFEQLMYKDPTQLPCGLSHHLLKLKVKKSFIKSKAERHFGDETRDCCKLISLGKFTREHTALHEEIRKGKCVSSAHELTYQNFNQLKDDTKLKSEMRLGVNIKAILNRDKQDGIVDWVGLYHQNDKIYTEFDEFSNRSTADKVEKQHDSKFRPNLDENKPKNRLSKACATIANDVIETDHSRQNKIEFDLTTGAAAINHGNLTRFQIESMMKDVLRIITLSKKKLESQMDEIHARGWNLLL